VYVSVGGDEDGAWIDRPPDQLPPHTPHSANQPTPNHQHHQNTTNPQVANLISKPSGVRDLLSQDIYIHKDLSDRVALLNATLPKAVKVRAWVFCGCFAGVNGYLWFWGLASKID
jgi:hypothetical protein